MGTFRRLVCIAVCFLGSGCASSQLNYNAADLASSLNSLQKRQIFFNLAQALNDPEFVPSQVTVSIGTAQAANAVTPSISLPLGSPLATTSRFTSAANPSARFSSQITTPAPGRGAKVTDPGNQSWTMVPANSSNQIRRLRSLYQYATGTMPRTDMTRDLTQEEAERQFLCEYPCRPWRSRRRPRETSSTGWKDARITVPDRRAHAWFMPIRLLPRDRTASCASTPHMPRC